MKIDFTKPLLTIKGTPLKMTEDPNSPDTTLADVVTNALLIPSRDPMPFDENANAFKLALRINNEPANCEVKSEEITLIKQAIGRNYGPNVCGPADILLEG
ncbi:hypothetical protein ACFX5Q_07300 [Mesorhizobium sp. IMUNJ 23033]|uniref:hypothetical protein n=1 Tax=Mesorhizobium sp. IMUNJ 23033 TaxID=3378039 RepID=UPI00384AB871